MFLEASLIEFVNPGDFLPGLLLAPDALDLGVGLDEPERLDIVSMLRHEPRLEDVRSKERFPKPPRVLDAKGGGQVIPRFSRKTGYRG